MEQGKYSRTSWLTAATRGIRFGPDREEVARELLEHLEDKTADLQRIFPDLDLADATELALSQMGDPEEIGMELAKIHTPWLGYLWQASRWLLMLVVCALAVSLVSAFRYGLIIGGVQDWLESRRENRDSRIITRVLYEEEPVTALESLEEAEDYRWWKGVERLVLYDDVAQSASLGDAEITLTRAALWQMEEGRDLYARISIDYDRAWEAAGYLQWYLQAEDSLGNHYGHQMTYKEKGAHMSGFQSFGRESRRGGYTWNFCLENLPEEAEWVRFTYALRPAADFAFVIDLSGEGVE